MVEDEMQNEELDEDPNAMNEDPAPQAMQVWQPGMGEDDEELECDPSAYHCLHTFRLEWPCLTFEFLRDSLGAERTAWPHTVLLVAGTQAAQPKDNTLALVRLSAVNQTYKAPKPNGEESGSESESSESEDEDNEPSGRRRARVKAGKNGPVMHLRRVAHPQGGVNKVRSCPQAPQIVASSSDSASVQVWDLSQPLDALSAQTAESAGENASAPPARLTPLQMFKHADEGWALAWSPLVHGRLLSGDCAGKIQLWEPSEGGKWGVGQSAFQAPAGSGFSDNPSVEDLQWSPSETTVFASCSADQTVRIWDSRLPPGPALTVRAHKTDVNVLSWSSLTACMLASGSDDGSFRIWDLRSFKADGFVAGFTYHKKPITSIEWSPFESPMLATCSADNQMAVWDLSVERDTEEEAEVLASAETPSAAAPAEGDLPAQLLFVHQGQNDLKEMHWHPHIPGMCATTAADSFNLLRPSNL